MWIVDLKNPNNIALGYKKNYIWVGIKLFFCISLLSSLFWVTFSIAGLEAMLSSLMNNSHCTEIEFFNGENNGYIISIWSFL